MCIKNNESIEEGIVDAYKQGMTINEIVKKFSISKYGINSIAIKHNLTKRNINHYSREPIIREYWDAGERDINVLAEKAQCTRETVLKAIKKINGEHEKEKPEEHLKKKKRITINIGDKIAYGIRRGYLNKSMVVEKIENGFAICRDEKGLYQTSFTAFELAKMFEKGEAKKVGAI